MTYCITRKIEIDAGHRIPDHNSKCFSIHGHRYRIEVGILAEALQKEGSEADMIKDFSFLKGVMMSHIDSVCDHSLMLYVEDPVLSCFFDGDATRLIRNSMAGTKKPWYVRHHCPSLPSALGVEQSFKQGLAITICSFIPTAERLAEAWWHAMKQDFVRACGQPPIHVRVWETPNVTAVYQP